MTRLHRPTRSRSRARIALATLVAATAFGGCAALDGIQRKAIFQVQQPQDRWHRAAPEGTETFDISLADGGHVHAWYLKADEPDAPTVLYLHGSRWNLNNSVFRFERWHALGFNVLAIDYRGFGHSSSILPSEETAIDDARAGFAELKRREPDPRRRFVYGHSLGGAVAIALADGNGASFDDAIAGVIVESSFTRLIDVGRASRWGWIPGLSLLITQSFDSIARVRRVDEPLLVIHGTRDWLIPHSMADDLFAAAVSTRRGLRRLLKIEGGSHSGAGWAGGSDYGRAIREFVREASISL